MCFSKEKVQAVPPWPIEAPPKPDALAVCNNWQHQLSKNSHRVTGNTGNQLTPFPWAPLGLATTLLGRPVPPGKGLVLPIPRRATLAAPPSTDYPVWSRQQRPPEESRTYSVSSLLQPGYSPGRLGVQPPLPREPPAIHVGRQAEDASCHPFQHTLSSAAIPPSWPHSIRAGPSAKRHSKLPCLGPHNQERTAPDSGAMKSSHSSRK